MFEDAKRASGLVRYLRPLAASLALAGGLAWVMKSGGLPFLPPKGTLAKVELLPFVGFVLGMLSQLLIRLGRVQFLLAPVARVPFWKVMVINGISIALITFLPLRLGEVTRPAMLREKGKLSAMAVTATVAAERILDGIVFSLMLLLGLWVAEPHLPLPTHIGDLPLSAALVPRAARLASVGFTGAFVLMVIFYVWRDFARRLTLRVVGAVSRTLAEKVANLLSHLSDGLKFLSNLRHALPYLAVTLIAIFAHVWAIQLLADAAGLPELTLAECSVIVGVLALGFAVPNAPGFFGAIQLALYAGLAVYIDPNKVAHEGALFVFLFYVTYLALIIVVALVALVSDYVISAYATATRAER
jgi:hypothetical protein